MAKSTDSGNAMDYEEHEKTYAAFLAFAKWGVIANVALLVSMALALVVMGSNMLVAILFTIIICAIVYFLIG